MKLGEFEGHLSSTHYAIMYVSCYEESVRRRGAEVRLGKYNIQDEGL